MIGSVPSAIVAGSLLGCGVCDSDGFRFARRTNGPVLHLYLVTVPSPFLHVGVVSVGSISRLVGRSRDTFPTYQYKPLPALFLNSTADPNDVNRSGGRSVSLVTSRVYVRVNYYTYWCRASY